MTIHGQSGTGGFPELLKKAVTAAALSYRYCCTPTSATQLLLRVTVTVSVIMQILESSNSQSQPKNHSSIQFAIFEFYVSTRLSLSHHRMIGPVHPVMIAKSSTSTSATHHFKHKTYTKCTVTADIHTSTFSMGHLNRCIRKVAGSIFCTDYIKRTT